MARLVLSALAALLVPPMAMPQTPAVKLIAHRGGVVGDAYAENSPAALQAAIERGYWMVEVDVRESKDGRLVVHHDPDFRDFYNDPRLLEQMTWAEIHRLRADPGGSRPLEFHEWAGLCRGKMRIMLDTKPPEHADDFYAALERAMQENGLLAEAFIIGTPESRRRFLGKARVGVDRRTLAEAVERGEDVARRYFLFEHGRDLDAAAVRGAQRLGVPVVPSINIFHYDDLPDHMAAAEADVKKMLALGVDYFQIDSPYDRWLNSPGSANKHDLPDRMAAAEADVKKMLALGVEYFQIDSPYDRWLNGPSSANKP